MKIKYQSWLDTDDNSCTFAESTRFVKGNCVFDLLSEKASMQYEIEAESWDDAMKEHYSRQGWGEYKKF